MNDLPDRHLARLEKSCSGPSPSLSLAQLGTEHIAAYSPQARGRSERVFRTLQERLPKELGLAGITGIETADRWLAEAYLPEHNARSAKPPAEQDGSAFVADRTSSWRPSECPENSLACRFKHGRLGAEYAHPASSGELCSISKARR